MSTTAMCGRQSGEDRLGLGQVAAVADHEQPVVEGQLDQIDDERSIVEDEGPAGSSAAVGA